MLRRAVQDAFGSASSSTIASATPSDGLSSTGGTTDNGQGGMSAADYARTTPNSTAVNSSSPSVGCSHSAQQDMGLNDNVAAYLFTGMMFTLRTHKPINITTFEVDVRLDRAGDSLDIEVFTLSGDYYGLNGNETAWTQIADTKAIPIPDTDSALIPVQDFETVAMGADELRSFYITLKGSFLDAFASAMDERGARDRDFEAFQLDVGGGFSEYKFPAAFDETVHPKFAGVIHYQESSDCVSPADSVHTVVKFDFLLDIYEFDEAVFKEVAAVVKSILVDQVSKSDGLLKEAAVQHSLLLVEDPSGSLPSQPLPDCPEPFQYCTGITVSAKFDHSASLGSSDAQYLLYGLADKVANNAASQLKRKHVYVGNSRVSATFKMALGGVSANTPWNNAQQKYFIDFIVESIRQKNTVELLDMTIDDQHFFRRRKLQDKPSSLEITGMMRGLQFYYLDENEFVESIGTILQENSEELIDRLTFDASVGSDFITEDDARVFLGMTNIVSELEAVPREYNPPPLWNSAAPTPTPPEEGANKADIVGKTEAAIDTVFDEAANTGGSTWMIVGAVAAVAIVLLLIGCFYCRQRRKRKMRIPQSEDNQKETGDSDIKTEVRSQADDAARSVDTTVDGEESPMSRSNSFDARVQSDLSSRAPRNGIRKSVSFDSAESANSQSGRPLQRNMSVNGFPDKPSPPHHEGLQSSMLAYENLLPGGTVPGSPRRGRKSPARSVSTGGPRAPPRRSPPQKSVDDIPKRPGAPPRRAPAQRSASFDYLSTRGSSFGQLPRKPMPPLGPPARGPPRRSASADSPTVGEQPSLTGLVGPARLPSRTPPEAETVQFRYPSGATAAPQRTQSERPASERPAPPNVHRPRLDTHHPPQPTGLQRIPSMRINKKAANNSFMNDALAVT